LNTFNDGYFHCMQESHAGPQEPNFLSTANVKPHRGLLFETAISFPNA